MLKALCALSIFFDTPTTPYVDAVRMPSDILMNTSEIYQLSKQKPNCNEKSIEDLVKSELLPLCQELSEKNGFEKEIDCVEFVKKTHNIPARGEKLYGAIFNIIKAYKYLSNKCLTALYHFRINDDYMTMMSYQVLNASEWNKRRIQKTGDTILGSRITKTIDHVVRIEVKTSPYIEDVVETAIFVIGDRICEKCTEIDRVESAEL